MKFSLTFVCFLALAVLFINGRISPGKGTLTSVETSKNGISDSLGYQIELGKRLFYDPIMSRDSTVSCATCHKPELAFTDGLVKSVGIRNQEVSRNAPTLTNVRNRKYLLLDGVNPSLEAQVTVPIQEHKEFDFHILLLVDRLNSIERYTELAEYGFGSNITPYVITKSIANFERTLISDNSPFDQYKNGDKNALSKSELRGKKLFYEKLYCGKCHNGVDLTNDALTNNGLYENYTDSGRMRLTGLETDRSIFKVPTLRNIEVTGPYMHDGSIKTLREVVEHYSQGGKNHPNQSEIIKPFTLTNKECKDLINFLKSLTDKEFLKNSSFRLNQ